MEIYDENVSKYLGISPEISSLKQADQLHDRFIKFREQLYFGNGMDAMPHYRSEQKFGWDIIPGVFRTGQVSSDLGKALEKKAALRFHEVVKEKIGPKALRDLFNHEKYGKDWDLLFQAQHAGIKTTLIDWTARIERSIFFAVENSKNPSENDADGQLWTYMIPTEFLLSHNDYPIRDTFYDQDPSIISHGAMINVSVLLDNLDDRVFESRIFKQGGRFYISSADKCSTPLNRQAEIAKHLFRFRIPADRKPIILSELAEVGITREYLFFKENPEHQALIDSINEEVYS